MGLESTATYIDSLVVSFPLGTDDKSTADDHIRLIKAAIKRTFPNIAGEVSVSYQTLNNVAKHNMEQATSASFIFAAPLTLESAFRASGALLVSLSGQGSFSELSLTGIEQCAVVRLQGSSAGIIGMAGGSDGRVVFLVNETSGAYFVRSEHSDAAVTNRFRFAFGELSGTFTGAALAMQFNQMRCFFYDGTDQRWRWVRGQS